MKLALVAVVLISIVAVLFSKYNRSLRSIPSSYRKKALLTENEKEFYLRLRAALPNYTVFPQVAMGALMAVSNLKGSEALRARSKFSQKIVDFVVCDSNLRVLGLVELDDKTHSKEKDRARDLLTRSAGYWTIRYESRAKPSPSIIAADVSSKVKKNS